MKNIAVLIIADILVLFSFLGLYLYPGIFSSFGVSLRLGDLQYGIFLGNLFMFFLIQNSWKISIQKYSLKLILMSFLFLFSVSCGVVIFKIIPIKSLESIIIVIFGIFSNVLLNLISNDFHYKTVYELFLHYFSKTLLVVYASILWLQILTYVHNLI